MYKFVFILQLMHFRKDKINSKGTTDWLLFSSFGSSTMSEIVERVCTVRCSAMVLYSRFTWITNSSDHRRVWTANHLHTMQLPNALGHKATTSYAREQDVYSSNPPVVTGICDPSKSWARHHHSLKLGSKLKYLNIKLFYF